MFIDPDTYYTHDLSPKAGKEAFQAAGSVRPGSRLDRKCVSVWTGPRFRQKSGKRDGIKKK